MRAPIMPLSTENRFWKTTQQMKFDPESLKSKLVTASDTNISRYKPRAVSNYGSSQRQLSSTQHTRSGAFFATNPWAAWNDFPQPKLQQNLLPSQDAFKESATTAFSSANGRKGLAKEPSSDKQSFDLLNGKR